MMEVTPETKLRQALVLAISIEQHNGQVFREWSKRFRDYDPAVSVFLDELADEEVEHEQELLKFYQRLFGPEVPDNIPPPEELTAYTANLTAFVGHFFVMNSTMAQSLLQMALDIERFTRQFYAELLANATDPSLIALYRRLGEFEEHHERLFMERLQLERNKAAEQAP